VPELVREDLLGYVVGQLDGPVGVDQAVLEAEEAVVLQRGRVQEVEALDDVLGERHLEVAGHLELLVEQDVLKK
jgi:hypothetical protein